MAASEERYEIAFFDVETTVPRKPGQRFAILEFGAILVCPRKLVELRSFSTLVRPSDLSLISSSSVRCNGISAAAVASSPSFSDVADAVYDLLHGRIWAGHNILRFDCARIREAFAEILRPPPEPKGTIDSLALLTQKFGRRAGDMKMATLATYFGLGQQSHRSLDDVRMNLEVLKYCATVLFLESSLPDVFTTNSWVLPNAVTRSRSNRKSSPQSQSPNPHTPFSPESLSTSQVIVENHLISSLMAQTSANLAEPNTPSSDPFDMARLSAEITIESRHDRIPELADVSSVPCAHQVYESSAEFLDPDEVIIPSVIASSVPMYNGARRIKLLHNENTLQLKCARLKVRFGISTKFVDHAGRPRLSFVVDAPPSLCRVLDWCDDSARKVSSEFGSGSEWRHVVSRKNGFVNYPTVRLHIPTAVCGEIAIYATEIYQKDNSGLENRLVFSKFDASELTTLFTPGIYVDAFFSLDPYDYQQNSGIRLVAKKLIIHSD